MHELQEVSRGNEEGARIFAEVRCVKFTLLQMVTQYKNQRNKYVFMACKMDIAAAQMKAMAVNQAAMEGIAKATSCMQGIQSMSPVQVGLHTDYLSLITLQAFKVFGEFNTAMENQFVEQERQLSKTNGQNGRDEQSAWTHWYGYGKCDFLESHFDTNNQESANELLEQAQMKVAAEGPLASPTAFATPEAIPDKSIADLASRLDALMPGL